MCCSLEGRNLTTIAVFEPFVVSKNLWFRRVNELSAGHFCRKGLHPEVFRLGVAWERGRRDTIVLWLFDGKFGHNMIQP
jgi:hypothetical protein